MNEVQMNKEEDKIHANPMCVLMSLCYVRFMQFSTS